MERNHQPICIVAFFTHEAFFCPLSNIRKIIRQIHPKSRSIITISPELVDRFKVEGENDDVIIYKSQTNPLFCAINYFFLNVKIARYIGLRSRDFDCLLFFKETGLLLPMIFAKILKKKVLWLLPASLSKMNEHNNNLSSIILIPIQSLSHRISDKIILYSPNLINEWNLQIYSEKILIAHEHLINTDMFTTIIPLIDRPLLIGYIGRLSEEKGVKNFVQALPLILNNRKDIKVLMGGDGPLKEEITKFLQAENLTDRVHIAGWIAHEQLPEYLNKLRLLVIPSYTEGLPNIMLEAMACGTPVLATPVGAIPDTIREGETGFVMKDNSILCIARNVTRALDSPDVERVAKNGRHSIERNFTFDKTIEQWEKILDEI